MWGLGRRGGGWRRVPRLSKECSFTILLASTWALIRGEGSAMNRIMASEWVEWIIGHQL